MQIVNCCGTCVGAKFINKKSKTITCEIDDNIYSQYGYPCTMYVEDVERVERIKNYVKIAR